MEPVMQGKPPRSRLDQLGVLASSICAVHCALGAVLVGASGLVGSFVQDERVEAVLLISAVVVALIACGAGYRRHRDKWVLVLVALGLLLLGVGRIVDLSGIPEPVTPITAAAFLIGAHIRNARLLHRVHECCTPEGCAAS
jgi:hypothetical protein